MRQRQGTHGIAMKKQNYMPFSNCKLPVFLAAISNVFVFAFVGCAGYTEQSAGNSFESQGSAISDHGERNGSLVSAWSGTLDRSEFAGIGERIISNESSWTRIWNTLHGDKEVPEVDFEKYLVYVDGTDSNDPNQREFRFVVDSQQSLSVEGISTALGFFRSESLDIDIYLVDRSGISNW